MHSIFQRSRSFRARPSIARTAGGDEEVGGDHVISRSGVDCGGDIDEEQEVKMEKRHIHVSEIVHIGKEANNTEDEPLESGNVRVFKNEEKE